MSALANAPADVDLGAWNQGDTVPIRIALNRISDGAAVDPSTGVSSLTASVTSKTADATTSYTAGVGVFVRNSTGDFTLSIDTTTAAGEYWGFAAIPYGDDYTFTQLFRWTVRPRA